MTDVDALCKKLLSSAMAVEQLIRAFLPAEAVETIDFASLSPLPTESVSRNRKSGRFEHRRNDVMWRFELNDGSPGSVLLMVENQSGADALMPVRIQQYVRSWYRMLAESRKADVLPLIVPVVICHGDEAWRARTRLGDLVRVPPGFEASGIGVDGYILVDERRLYEEGALASGNLFEPLIRALQTDRHEGFVESFGRTLDWLRRSGAAQEYVRPVESFRLELKDRDGRSDLAAMMRRGGERNMSATLADLEEQIRQQGVQQGMREVGRHMLGDGWPEREVRRYTGLSIEEIRRIRREIEGSRS